MKKAFAITRTEKIKAWSTLAKSVGHNLRTSADDRQHINPNSEPNRVLVGSENWLSEWKEQVEGMHLRKLAQGCNHTLAREFFFGTSPEWAASRSKAQIDAWAEANIQWVKKRFGAENVKFAILHLDEQTPHIACYVVGVKKDPKNRGNGWTLSDSALKLGGNKNQLSILQDEYAEAMKPFELERGLKNSKAKHKTTSQWIKEQKALETAIAEFREPIKYPSPPKPTMSDRLDVEGYGKKIAKETAKTIFQQMKPYKEGFIKQNKAFEEQKRELSRLSQTLEQLKPLAEAFKQLLSTLLGKEVELNTIKGQTDANAAFLALLELIKPKKEQKTALESDFSPITTEDSSEKVGVRVVPGRRPQAPHPRSLAP